jgi:hypothetical protein
LIIQILEGTAMNHMRTGVVGGIVYAAVTLCCANVLGAVDFAGGTGEPNNPYQIATAEQLIAVGSDPNLAKSHFVLTASIDLSGTTWSSPVIPSFYGSLDGNGLAIQGLKARGAGPQGLFGYILNTARVTNLNLVDVDLAGTGSVGGLAAENTGVIHDCRSAGKFVGTAGNAGGLVGLNIGTITGSSSAGEVVGYYYVGGLVGRSQRGILVDCRSAAVVTGSYYVGGLVGASDGSISVCYSDGDVVGQSAVGGLVGINTGGISSCYSAGTVAGADTTGGLVGDSGGRISSCYSVVGVAGQKAGVAAGTVGGLVGRNVTYGEDVVRDCYFLIPADGDGPDNEMGVSLTTAQMMQQASFPGWDFWGTNADGTGDHWFMPIDSPPVLVWQTEVTGLQRIPDVTGLPLDRAKSSLATAGFVPGDISYDFWRALPAGYAIHAEPHSVAPDGVTIDLVASLGGAYDWTANPGEGSAANPYQIGTAGQLGSLADHSELWDKHFVLTADLDLTGRVYATALISPGTKITTGFSGTAFMGSFDGQGHAIRNLFIETENRGYVGLFGMIGSTGQVSNLGLLDAVVKTPSNSGTATRSGAVTAYFGVLAGCNYGEIAGCSATGIVMSQYTDGGLVGINLGSMKDCHSDVIVTGTTSIRGR